MKLLITGAGGLIGSRVVEILSNKNIETATPSSRELDIQNHQKTKTYIKQFMPDCVIHAAAMTDVNKAEEERNDISGTAWKINVNGTISVAEAAKSVNAFFIQISTDMVFSGAKENKGPYSESEKPETDPAKLCWYGYTKSEAERRVGEILSNDFAIIRPSNPVRKKYDRKPDYVKKILNAYDQGNKISLFNDQYLTLTYIDEVAAAIEKIIENRYTGIFHVSSTDLFTPFELGEYVLETARGVKNRVQAGSLEKFLLGSKWPSRYPQYGGLKVGKTQSILNIKFNSWRQTIDAILKN